MIDSLKNIFNIPDLRRRVLYTLGLLAVYRVGAYIPTPGVDSAALAELFEQNKGTIFSFINMFTGGALSRLTIFALGIMPYISASIILQLLGEVWPYLKRLQQEGELGRKKITQYTRYGTVILSVIQSFGIAIGLEAGVAGTRIVISPGWGFRLMTVLSLTTGTAFIMWLGEKISDRGIGNGISLIIFAGIIVGLPNAIINTFASVRNGEMQLYTLAILLLVMFGVVFTIVFVERGQRRIPIQYAKRVVGRRVMGGATSHLPLRVNMSGVIPAIFASSILLVPQTIAQFVKADWMQKVKLQLGFGMPIYELLYAAAIIFFCYFYTWIVFNPVQVAENLRKYGGYIPGIRPGRKTSDYIERVLARVTLAGALYLALVCILPDFLVNGFKIDMLFSSLGAILPGWFTNGLGVSFYFGGTSLLIVVGVAMDTVQQIESQLIMRHYDGFMKKGRIRGRR